MEIEWRDVPGWTGIFQVSNDGQVRSLDRHRCGGGNGGRRLVRGRIRKPRINRHGYYTIPLTAPGRTEYWSVHRMVALTFNAESYFEGAVIRHYDGDALNNVATNLVWGTQSENLLDAVRHGTNTNASKTHCPSNHPYSDENTVVWYHKSTGRKQRKCRLCQRDRWRATREARQKAGAA